MVHLCLIMLIMKAITLVEPGSTSNLIIPELPVPQLKRGGILIKVTLNIINPVDVRTRQGGGILNYVNVNCFLTIASDLLQSPTLRPVFLLVSFIPNCRYG